VKEQRNLKENCHFETLGATIFHYMLIMTIFLAKRAYDKSMIVPHSSNQISLFGFLHLGGVRLNEP